MKHKDIISIIIFLLLLLVVEELMARGGGGGGHGSSGGGSHSSGSSWSGEQHPLTTRDLIIYICVFILGSFSALITIVVMLKSNASKKIIKKIILSDTFWDFNEMKSHAHEVFYKIQDAWGKRDIDRAKNYITPELHRKYKIKLEYLRMEHKVNIIRNINITDIKIIGCEDYKDDSKDRYIAYIKGTILDFMVDDRTGRNITNEDKETETFSDTYHFVRVDNNWLLENIDNSVSMLDVITTRNFKEE